jgi:flagellar biosynthesis/type III secretory pathway protein FliH
MRNNEKFMFDTIFDELEPILPEVAETDHSPLSGNEEQLEIGSEEVLIKTFNEADIIVARQEGFDDGKKQGASETLSGMEKTLNDTLTSIAHSLSVFQSEQTQANQEVSNSASTLALTIVRKFFPTLNEKTALNEINSVLVSVLKRLIGEPQITIKVNPIISNDLSEKLKRQFIENDPITNVSIVADEKVDIGDCNIKWSNGTAERNLNTLTHEIDDIIAQNSMQKTGLTVTTEENQNEANSDDSTNKENN